MAFEQDSSMNREEHDHDNISKRVIITPNTANPHVGSVSIFGTVQSTPGNVTLNPSDAHIGSVSIFGSITANTGMNTLFPGPNQIGSVTVSNFTAPNTGNVTLNPSDAKVGIVTVGNAVNILGNTVKDGSGTNYYPVTTGNGYLVVYVDNFALGEFGDDDGIAGNITSALVYSNNFVSNVAGTWDRMRSIQVSTASGFGVPAVGLVGFDGTNYPKIRTDTGGVLNANVSLKNSSSNIGSVSVLGGSIGVTQLGNISLNPSSAHIGSVSIFGSITANTGMTTLFGGPNQIGSVTVSHTVTVDGSAVTQPISHAALTELAGAIDTEVQVDVITMPTTTVQATNLDIRDLASGSDSVAAVQSGSWDVRSVLSLASVNANVGGTVAVSNFVAPNTANVTLNPSSAHIGSVSLFGDIPVTMSSISLYPSSANIGSVSILGGVVQANAGTNLNTSALALEAGGNLAAIAASLDTLDSIDYMLGSDFVAPNLGNVSLNASSANIGSVSVLGGTIAVSNFVAPNVGNVSLNASSANIGSVSVLGGTIAVSNFVAPNVGNVSLNASSANIGSVSILGGVVAVTQSGTWDEVGINDSGNSITVDATNLDIRDLVNTDVVTAELSAVDNAVLDAMAASLDTLDSVDYMLGSDFVAPNLGNVTLNPSPNFVGLVTTYPGRSLSTSMATIYSGAGNYTLFVPPTGQKFFVHNLMVNSQGVSDGHIKAGANPKWPWAGLATYGGFAKTFLDPGLAMGAVNEAFVVTLNSAATISVDVGVHFE